MVNELVERGILPDPLVRLGIRHILRGRLSEQRARYQHDGALTDHLKFLSDSPIAIQTNKANEQHYEQPAEFFQLVLGKYLKYSACYWPNDVQTLDEAEKAALDLVIERSQIRDGQKILDLGCGWGSFSLYVAEKFSDAEITAVSNSRLQKNFIEEACEKRGLKNVRVYTADVNALDLDETYDRIVSVEMFEHARNYEALLAKVASWLKPDGALFVHVFAHRDFAYVYEDQGPSDWMTRHFFSGGQMPSVELLTLFQKNLRLTDSWTLSGTHYERTAEAWLANMNAQKPKIIDLFRRTYGEKEAAKQWHRWRVFFMACAELFGYRGGKEWCVAHYLFDKKTAVRA